MVSSGERNTFPSKFRALRIDKNEMRNFLAQASMEATATSLKANGLTFYMPMPDGSFQRFSIFEYYVMHPDLAAKFPDIKYLTASVPPLAETW